MKGYLFILLNLNLGLLYAQEINTGPRFTALGNTGAALQDVWSLQSNQAGITAVRSATAAAGNESDFPAAELSTQSVLFVYPYKNNVFGISFQNYGFSAYSEQRVGLTYAKAFGDKLSAAISFNMHQLKIPQYGVASAFSAEAGLQYKIAEKILLGSHISNPSGAGYAGRLSASLPVMLELGGAYAFSDKVRLSGSLVTVLNTSQDVRLGLEYMLADVIALRGGINLNPMRQFAGFGYKYKHLDIDAAVSAHPAIGYRPQIALAYEF